MGQFLFAVGEPWGSVNSAAVHVNSPARKKPKKPRQHAAHNMTWLNLTGGVDHTLWSAMSKCIVMWRRCFRLCSGEIRRIPFNT